MKTLKSMVPSRRATVRPRWQNQNNFGRIGGKAARNAASSARFARRMAKFERMGKFGGGFVRLVNWLMRKLGLAPRAFKPAPPSQSYKVEVG